MKKTNTNNFVCVILAAGKGKRMKSKLAKVLHPICGKSMLFYVIKLARSLHPEKIAIIVGRQKEKVIKEFHSPDIAFVEQTKLLGTGDAVKRTKKLFSNFKGNILILAGDTPLLQTETIKKMMHTHTKNHADVTLLSTVLDNPTGYGRIVRENGNVHSIVEEKDANKKQKLIKEVNAGVYIFKKEKLFYFLKKIKTDNKQQEYYLTDVIKLIRKSGGNVQALKASDWRETIGVNDRRALAVASEMIQKTIKNELMVNGVTFISPEASYVDYDVSIGKDTVIEPFVIIKGKTKIKDNCHISSFNTICDSAIGNNVMINSYCFIRSTRISNNSIIPAFTILGNEEKNKKNKENK